MDRNCAGLILASGLSERMGKPKALLSWDYSTTFLEKIISEYLKAGCGSIICTINRQTEQYCKNMNVPHFVKFVVNKHPEWGRFYSIKTGLKEVLESDFCFIQNVDNPFVNIEIIEDLYSWRSSEAWCSPVFEDKGGHPVLLPRMIIQKIVQENNLNTTLPDILNQYQKIKVKTDNDLVLRNINTPEDYLNFFGSSSL